MLHAHKLLWLFFLGWLLGTTFRAPLLCVLMHPVCVLCMCVCVCVHAA